MDRIFEGREWILFFAGIALGLPTSVLSVLMTFLGTGHNDGKLTLFLFVCYPLQGLLILFISKFANDLPIPYIAFLFGFFLLMLIQFPIYGLVCVSSVMQPLAKQLRLCAKIMLAHSVIAFVALCLFFLGIWR